MAVGGKEIRTQMKTTTKKGVAPSAAPIASKTTKEKTLTNNSKGKGNVGFSLNKMGDEEQFSRVNDGSDLSDVKEQRPK